MSLSVTALLQRRGHVLNVARVGAPETYDVATGAMSGEAPVTGTFRGVFTNYEDKDVDGTHVQMTDRKLLIDALSPDTTLTPQRGDTVDGTVTGAAITGGVVIERVRKYEPNGTPIAYVCQVRG
jgi:hypothetical protein